MALVQQIHDSRSKLIRALATNQSHRTCIRLWSIFVRTRDGNNCLQCESKQDLAAHHIFRKSFLPTAQYEPGNGITLCRGCHKELHSGFNGRPDMHLPMDAQGGEKAEDISMMLNLLVMKSREHKHHIEEWYYLSKSTLSTINLLQGFDSAMRLDTSRIEQAYIVWNQASLPTRNAILKANGFAPVNEPLRPGIQIVYCNE